MQTILITNYHPAGFAFALTEANEQVFIPPYATDGAQLTRGQHYQAVLIPNHKEQERDRTPYLAVSVLAAEPAEKSDDQPATSATSTSQNDRDEAGYNLICGNTYMTTFEITEGSGFDAKTAGNSANRLFNRGRIAKADVYNRIGQSRSSFVLWAENANKFVE